MALEPITRQSTPAAIFDQLAAEIVSGRMPAGDSLPAERNLSEQLGVSRPVVREALQRLAQAGLVETRHGGGTRVADWSSSGGLDLLPRLLVGSDGRLDTDVARSVLEMRVVVGSDAARRCAERADGATCERLGSIVTAMEQCGGDLARLADLDLDFWAAVVAGSDNIAYRLSYNSLVDTYRPIKDILAVVLRDELRSLTAHRDLVAAVENGDADTAEAVARGILESSDAAWTQALESVDRMQ